MRMPKIKYLSSYKMNIKKELLHAYLIKNSILILPKLMTIKNPEFITIKASAKTRTLMPTTKTSITYKLFST